MLEWRGDEILGELQQPFKEANELLGRNAQQQITSNKWAWPAAPSPRDIVDNGQLRDSYLPVDLGLEYEHTWNTDYAMAVHEGAVFKDGRSMPARPWMRQALKEFDFEGTFNTLARRRLS
jgi:hypothetical protein